MGEQLTPEASIPILHVVVELTRYVVAEMTMDPVLESILGSRSATLVLLFLENYNEGHASRIAKTFDVSVMGIQRQLKRLEENGVLSSRMVGSSRIFSFNDRNPTVKNLRSFLKCELDLVPEEYTKLYFRQRQRPRRSGKIF